MLSLIQNPDQLLFSECMHEELSNLQGLVQSMNYDCLASFIVWSSTHQTDQHGNTRANQILMNGRFSWFRHHCWDAELWMNLASFYSYIPLFLFYLGVIRTAVSDLDRESQDRYDVVIQATDMAGQLGGLSGSTTVTIVITDVNDNPPRFPQSKSERTRMNLVL